MRHLYRKILKYNVKKDLKAIKTIKKPLKGISCQGNMDMFFFIPRKLMWHMVEKLLKWA